MKKAISIVLVCVFVLSLCACGNGNIEAELKTGSWSCSFTALGVKCINTYTFMNAGKFQADSTIGSTQLSEEGTYVVEDHRIIATYESGETFEFNYTFEDGNLELALINDSGDSRVLEHNR